LNSANNIKSRFVYTSSENVPEYFIKSDTIYRLITDHLGSVRQVVSVATGEFIQKIDYDEYGNVLLNTNPDFQPFGYAGGLYDQHIKLVRFGARDYDAETGRWTVKDPIGIFGKNTNFYGYCINSPINIVDTDGKEIQPRTKMIVGSIIGTALSYMADELAEQLPEGRMRGAIRLLSSFLAFYSAYEATLYSLQAFVVAYSVPPVVTPTGAFISFGIGAFTSGLAAYNFAQAYDTLQKAIKDLNSGK